MTPEERRARQRRYDKLYRVRKARGHVRQLKPCGTLAAVSRHRRAGEPLCEKCRAAYREYQAGNQRRWRQGREAWDYWAGPIDEAG